MWTIFLTVFLLLVSKYAFSSEYVNIEGNSYKDIMQVAVWKESGKWYSDIECYTLQVLYPPVCRCLDNYGAYVGVFRFDRSLVLTYIVND